MAGGALPGRDGLVQAACRQGAPRAADSRPQRRPAGRDAGRRGRAARGLRRANRAPSSRGNARRCGRTAPRGPRARAQRPRARAAPARASCCSSEIGRPVSAEHLQCPLDTLGVAGRMRAAAAGSMRRELGMQRRPALRPGALLEARADRRVGLGQRRDAVQQRAEIQHRAADQQRHVAARADVGDQRPVRRARSGRRNTARRDRRCRPGDAAPARAPPRPACAVPMSMPR